MGKARTRRKQFSQLSLEFLGGEAIILQRRGKCPMRRFIKLSIMQIAQLSSVGPAGAWREKAKEKKKSSCAKARRGVCGAAWGGVARCGNLHSVAWLYVVSHGLACMCSVYATVVEITSKFGRDSPWCKIACNQQPCAHHNVFMMFSARKTKLN